MREAGATTTSARLWSGPGPASVAGGWSRPRSGTPWASSGRSASASVRALRVAATMMTSPASSAVSSKGGSRGCSPRWIMRTVISGRLGNIPASARSPTSVLSRPKVTWAMYCLPSLSTMARASEARSGSSCGATTIT